MSEVFVMYEYETYTTWEADPNDPWGRDSSGIHVRCLGVTTDDDPYGRAYSYTRNTVHGDEVKAGDTVHVVWTHYGDGDTFGNDEYFETLGVFTDLDLAKEFVKELRDPKAQEYLAESKVLPGTTLIVPWRGYFASFISLDIETFVVSK